METTTKGCHIASPSFLLERYEGTEKPIYLHKAKACRIMGYEACRVASATTVMLPSSFDTTISRLLTQHEVISSKIVFLGQISKS